MAEICRAYQIDRIATTRARIITKLPQRVGGLVLVRLGSDGPDENLGALLPSWPYRSSTPRCSTAAI